MRQRWGFFLLIITALVIGIITIVLVRYAQGYRLVLDGKNVFKKDAVKVTSTGLLVSTSSPDGASVYIDNQLFETQTVYAYGTPKTVRISLPKKAPGQIYQIGIVGADAGQVALWNTKRLVQVKAQ